MNSLLLGLTILIIGDSHMATPKYLITTLHDDLTRQGAKVISVGACGVPTGAWVAPRPVPCGTAERVGNGPIRENKTQQAVSTPIDKLIEQYHPNLVIVQSGDTMAGYTQRDLPRGWIQENVSALTTRIRAHNLPCLWVGPSWGTEGGPYFKTFARVKEYSDFVSGIVAPCEYVDSLTLSKPGEWPTFDGQHHTAVGYRAWGDALTRVIDQSATVKAVQQRRQ